MKRWRPPRPLILFALLLLAGAVVNVAVAWVLVGAPDSWTPGGPSREWHDGAEVLRNLDQRDWPPLAVASIRRGLGWTEVQGYHGERASELGAYSARITGGWPAHSVGYRNIYRYRGAELEFSESPVLRVPYGSRGRLPLTPLPAGFAINTLFYTALLALPLSFFPIRRRLRARRGRCPKCGYDLAGLGGADRGGEGGAPCPECGATR